MTHRFTRTALVIWSGLLVWMGNFLFVYVFAALACAQRFADVELLGIAVVPFATTASSILAAIVILTVMWIAARNLRVERSSDPHSRFIRFVTLGSAGLAFVALVWVALPALLANPGCSST